MSSMLGPALRMVVSLAIVLALMYVAARLLGRSRGIAPAKTRKRRQSPHPRAARSLAATLQGRAKFARTAGRRSPRRRARLEVIARQPLGKTASVAVVRVADRTMLLGVTDSAVQLLSEIDATLFEDGETPVDLAALASPADTDELELAVPQVSPGAAGTAALRSTVSVLDLLRERTVRRA
ncbi:MAG: FliO/MopB family protein [Acidothermaceae bacterium]